MGINPINQHEDDILLRGKSMEINTMQLNTIHWEVTPFCNHNCIHCYNHWRTEEHQSIDAEFNRNITSEELLKTAEIIANENTKKVVITGGEPLSIFNQLKPVMEYFHTKNMEISINTNITLITDEIARFIKEHNITMFISIPSANSEVCDKITGVTGSFDRINKGLLICKKYHLNAELNMVVTKINRQTVRKTALYLKEMGVQSFNCTRAMCPPNATDEYKSIMLDYEELNSMIDELKQLREETGMHIGYKLEYSLCGIADRHLEDMLGSTKCYAGKNQLAITFNGDIKACEVDSTVYGNISTTTLSEAHSKMSDWDNIEDKPSECQKCKSLKYCGGGCRADAENCYGSRKHLDTTANTENIDRNVIIRHPAYKYSQFNISFHEDEKYIWVYNTYSTKVAKIPKTKNKLYQRLNPIPLIVVEEGLVKAQILVPADLDETQRLKDEAHKEIDRTDNLFLSIFTTLACNYRCVYCFESAQLCNTEHMTTETADDIINFVKRKVEENNITRPITIKWFGGEPLLNFPIIEHITNNLRNNNIDVSAMMYTNGRLLTKETALKLRDLGVNKQVVIPIDGLAPTYAKLKQCSESDFYTVIKNIQDCQDILNIIIHINVSEASKDDADELYRQLREDYKITVPISFTDVQPQNTSNISDTNSIEYTNMQSIKDKHNITDIGMRAKVGCEGRFKEYYTIGPDGSIYICEHQIGIDKYKYGNIKELSSIDKTGTVLDIDVIIDDCKDCHLLPVCMGKCSVERMLGKIDCQKDLRIQQLQKDLIKRFK